MRDRSIVTKLVLVVSAILLIESMGLIYMANLRLTKIIDNNFKQTYASRLNFVMGMIQNQFDRVEATGMVDVYQKGLQDILIKNLKKSYHNIVGAKSYLFIIDSEANVVIHPDYLTGDKSLVSDPNFQRMIDIKHGELFFKDRKSGEQKWVLLRYFNKWGWQVGYIVPTEIKYEDVRNFRNFLIWVILLIISIVIIFLLWFVVKLSQPIVDLAEASKAMQQGDLDFSVDTLRDDELGILARNFVNMRQVIKEQLERLNNEIAIRTRSEAELKRHRKNLDIIIHDRTSELHRSKKMFEDIALSSGDLIWEIDRDYRYTYVAGNSKGILGVESPEAIGSKPFDGMDITERRRVETRYKQFFTDYLPIVDFEMIRQRANGENIYVLVNGVAVFEEGQCIGYRGVEKDITLKKITERDLEDRTAELERSNLELEEFAFIASHDLQEPLRKIEMFGNELNKYHRDDLSEEGLDYLFRIKSAAGRMRDMVNDLLSLSRISRNKEPFVEISLNQLIDEVLNDFEASIRDKKALIKVETLGNIKADRSQIKQLFMNLIGNALKYQRESIPPLIEIRDEVVQKASRKWLLIFVKDNGIGFDEKYVEKIFAPFERLHGIGQYEGSGMGLAICSKIVKRHGGKITATSTPNESSTFIVSLPL